MLYLKSPLSNAIRLMTAACSAAEVTLYSVNELVICVAACAAVAHSPAAGALSQDAEFGEIVSIWAVVIVAQVARGRRMGPADVRNERERMVMSVDGNIVVDLVLVLGKEC